MNLVTDRSTGQQGGIFGKLHRLNLSAQLLKHAQVAYFC